MARPLVLAVCLVLGLVRGAGAGPGKTSKVTIETDPPGAKVYFNVKEDGEVCTTPCTIDAPIGETPIIVEAENRRSLIENLIVPKKTARPIRVQYKLKPALGTLVVEGSDGATILIDDESQGTAPRRFDDLQAGAHHVVLQRSGKKVYDAFVEIETGREATVSAPRLAAESPPAQPAREAPAITATETAPAAAARRAPAFVAAAAMDVGFRQFTFHYPSGATQSTQKNDRETGEVLTGGIVELWPTTLLHLGVLPGLALYGRFELGVNQQTVTIEDQRTRMPVSTSLLTSWRSLEISARQRWTIAHTGALDIGAGYTDDRYQFEIGEPIFGTDQFKVVPDASYKAIRIGGRGSLLLGQFEPYLAAENRLVLSGGTLESRYRLGTSVIGYHGAIGTAVHLGHFEVRAEASLALYSWTFRPDAGDADQATGGSDVIEKIGLALGYAY